MLGQIAKFKDNINTEFKKFLDKDIGNFSHIESVIDYFALIEIFVFRGKSQILLEKTEPGVNYFVFPFGRVLASGIKGFGKDDLIGIDPMLTVVMEHPEWTAWEKHKNNSPQPDMPTVPKFTYGLDIPSSGWPQKRFIDLFVKSDNIRLYTVNVNDIKIKYDKNIIIKNNYDLNYFIDGKL